MSRAPTHNQGKAQGTFRCSQAPEPGGSADAALFDADQLVEKPCPVNGCGAIRLPGQDRVATCRHDLEPPDDRPYRRPNGCLNRQPANQFPEGY